MNPYKTMYFTLFHAMTDCISLLEQAQQQAEECFLAAEEEESELSLPQPSTESETF